MKMCIVLCSACIFLNVFLFSLKGYSETLKNLFSKDLNEHLQQVPTPVLFMF